MLANLQMLRGLAALGVVFYHTDYRLPGDVHTEFQGVAVFFVISGFIMTYITRKDANGFLTNRLIRIVPLYWVCTVAIALLAHANAWLTVKSLLFIPYFNFNHDPHPVLGVGWTLNMEIFFYALFALALLISHRWAPVMVAATIVAIVAAKKYSGCDSIACTVYGHDYVSLFPIGIAAFYLWTAGRGLAAGIPLVTLLTVMAVAGEFVAYQLQIVSPLTAWDNLALPGLIVLAALVCESAKWKAGAWALFLGNISYALYLTHTFTMELWLRSHIDFKHSTAAMVGTLAACVAVAACAHYWLERPMMAVLRRIISGNTAARRGAGIRSQAPIATS
jgi:exopolysaccharide production protein ExoZ